MKATLTAAFYLLFSFYSYSQNTRLSELLKSVQNAQALLKILSYSVERTDTLVTDDVRTMTGKVLIEADRNDTLFGFKWRAKKDIDKSERIYDGHIGYEADTINKTYQLLNSAMDLRYLLHNGGGQLVLPELVKIDTSQAKEIQISSDDKYYYLTLRYPDLTKYDVVNRRKIITIDKLTMLPMAVRNHQETYKKVQDLYFRITDIQINQPGSRKFSLPLFLKGYTYVVPAATKAPRQELKGKTAPAFSLTSLDGKIISEVDLKGRVVLLDFWEVWCGPCMESMPKVQALYNRFRSIGFEVYGITNDLKHLQSTKAFTKSKALNFPVLIGNEKFKKDYKLDGSVPLYILLDKKSTIKFVGQGYPPNIEELILNQLN